MVDDRPRWARLVHGAALLELVGLACLCAWRWHVDDDLHVPWMPVLCGAAAIGMWRRVAWGRFLFSAVSLLVCFVAVSVLTPVPDDAYGAGPALPGLIGFTPPLLAWWAIIMATTVLTLAPALAVGWRRHWFRSARW
jgi:hypothetical protein